MMKNLKIHNEGVALVLAICLYFVMCHVYAGIKVIGVFSNEIR